MPIPAFTDHGLLPTGLHECTVAEIRERFGGSGYGAGRHELMARLEDYVRDLRTTQLVAWVIVDGSFVTSKEVPGDIDLLVVLPKDHDMQRELRPFEENPLSRRWVAKRYQFDAFTAVEGTSYLDEHTAFFQQVKGSHQLRKGLLKVIP